MFENPRRGRLARNFTTIAPKILDLKSSSEQVFSRKLPLGAPDLNERLDALPFSEPLLSGTHACNQKLCKGLIIHSSLDLVSLRDHGREIWEGFITRTSWQWYELAIPYTAFVYASCSISIILFNLQQTHAFLSPKNLHWTLTLLYPPWSIACNADVISLRLVTSAKQRRYPCSGPPKDSTNYRKCVLIGKSTMAFFKRPVMASTQVLVHI